MSAAEPKPGKISIELFGETYVFDVPDMEPDPVPCITASEYAKRTGQNLRTVYGRLQRGAIEGEKVDGMWYIPEPLPFTE